MFVFLALIAFGFNEPKAIGVYHDFFMLNEIFCSYTYLWTVNFLIISSLLKILIGLFLLFI